MKITGDRLQYFQSLYEKAKSAAGTRNELIDEWEEQYRGSRNIDGSSIKAESIRNLTYECIESQVETSIPVPKVDPERWSEKTQDCAQEIERLCKNYRNKYPFEQFNDIDERNTYKFGASVWLLEWDSTIRTHNTSGDVKVTMIHPRDFFGQPGVYSIDDMDYCFMRFTSTKYEIRRKYGVSEMEAEKADIDTGSYVNDTEDVQDKDEIVTVVVCFYKNDDGEICKFVYSGDLILDDIEAYYHRKIKKCRKCGKVEGLCECENPKFEYVDDEYEVLDHDIVCNDGKYTIPALSYVYNADGTRKIDRYEVNTVIGNDGTPIMESVDGYATPMTERTPVYKTEKTKLPYYTPKRFPVVIRVNTSVSDQLYGQSDCEYLKPQQQDVNIIESRIMAKLKRSGVTPCLPEDATIGTNNEIFGQYIRLKPNESKAQYGTVDTTPNIQQDIAQSERIYVMAKRTLGITDTYQGFADTTAKSGKAKQVAVQQAAGRLASKRVMKQLAYSEIDRVIFELYLAYADELRYIIYTDEFGRTHGSAFNRYDFIHFDEDTKKWYYNDSFLFSVDLSGDVEQYKDQMWTNVTQYYQSGMFGNPTETYSQLMVWLFLEKYREPVAHTMVEMLTQKLEAERAQQQQMQALAAQGIPIPQEQGQQQSGNAANPLGSNSTIITQTSL